MKMTAIFVALAASLTAQSFEVASIKPGLPAGTPLQGRVSLSGGPGTSDPGRFTCENYPLWLLVVRAYDLDRPRVTYPSWMDTARFNIAAKIPEGTTAEQFRLMLQNLLADRFKLAVHFDKKQMEIYELTVAKGGVKMKEAGEGPAILEAPPNQPAFFTNRTDAPRTTMRDLALTLAGISGQPVKDATGLTGRYNARLLWVNRPQSLQPDGRPGPDGPDLFEAVQSQLGLKLEPKKAQVDILVVDHAEKIPTEN